MSSLEQEVQVSEEQKALESLSPEQLETAMIKKQEEVSPADYAAAFYHQNKHRVDALLRKLSKSSLIRINKAFLNFPFRENTLKNTEEKELAWAMQQMMTCKIIMGEQAKLNKIESAEELEKQNNESLAKGEKSNE